jgi:hypothetical protein
LMELINCHMSSSFNHFHHIWIKSLQCRQIEISRRRGYSRPCIHLPNSKLSSKYTPSLPKIVCAWVAVVVRRPNENSIKIP